MISICMCTYNGSKFVEEQLNSIVNQTTTPDEIIIFDDNSTDNTYEIICEFSKNYKNIKWIIKKQSSNKGWRVNFKEAINESTGDIIFLADQDDVWNLEKLERMTNIICADDKIDLLACGYESMSMEGCSVVLENTPSSEKIIKVDKTHDFMHPFRPGCAYCFKRKLLDAYNSTWYEDAAHDQVLWNLAFLNGSLYLYEWHGIRFRRHSNNASSYYDNRFSKDRYDKKIIESNTNFNLVNNYKLFFGDSVKSQTLRKASRWVKIRKDLYTCFSLSEYFKLMTCFVFYKSINSFFLDLYLIPKYRKH